MKHPVSFFLDCGAPTIYNKILVERGVKDSLGKGGASGATFKRRKRESFDYTKSETYKTYMTDLMAFLHKYGKDIDAYPVLDVINSGKHTLKNMRTYKKNKLDPIPVWHVGSPVKYLKRYVDKYEYMAIGGMTPNAPKVLVPILDRIWRDYLINDKGKPKIKVHGFAMTSFSLIGRYPWYSVDSTSWLKVGAFGKLLYPLTADKPMALGVSSDSPTQNKKNMHINTFSKSQGGIIKRQTLRNFKNWIEPYRDPEENFDYLESPEQLFEQLATESAVRCYYNALVYLNAFPKDNTPIMLFAGNGRKMEESQTFRNMIKKEGKAGILISAADLNLKTHGAKRFQTMITLKKEGEI